MARKLAHRLAHKLKAETTADPPDDDKDSGDGRAMLSRRSYVLMAGSAVAAVAGPQSDDSGVVSAKTMDATTVNAPDAYGYGGRAALSQPTSPEITANRPLGDDTRKNTDDTEITTAEELPLDTTVNKFLPANSSRWYALSVTEGESLQVDFQRSDPNGVTAIVLYDADGRFHSLRYAATDAPVQLIGTINTGGTVYLQIVDVQNGDGDYTLTTSIGETAGDNKESDKFSNFEETDTAESTEKTVRIVATSDESTNYEFTVSGELKPDEQFPDGSWEEIDDSTANGWVSSSADVRYDDFRFTGDIESFELFEGNADVFIDDELWDPAEIDEESTEKTVRIVATSDESTNYEFTVSGELKPGEQFPDGSWEEIDDSTANGWVSPSADVRYDDFRFTGDIESFELLEGNADVFIDDELWDPAEIDEESEDADSTEDDTTIDSELVEHRLIVISAGENNAHYNFTVTDTLRGGDQFPNGNWESITGNTADGWVSNDSDINYDNFYYRGEIESFSLLEGDAELRVDGKSVEIEPDGSVEAPTSTDSSEVDDNLGAQGYGMYEYGGISS